jgi:hypothetical protein
MRRLLLPPDPWVNDASFYFDGATRLFGGTGAAMDYPISQPLTCLFWIRLEDLLKHSIANRENWNTPFNGYDWLIMVGGQFMTYLSGSGGYGSDTVQVKTEAVLPANGVTWVQCISTLDGTGRADGCHMYLNRVDQRLIVDVSNLVHPVTGQSIQFTVGDALNGLTYMKGALNNLVIIEREWGQVEVDLYSHKNGKPHNYAGIPDIAHWWQFARTWGPKPDTTAIIYDRVGNIDLTVDGNGQFINDVP